MASRAQELMEKGDKKTKKFFGGQSKYEDARDLYQQAANQYKKQQDWPGACAAFEKCLAMDVKLKEDSDRVTDLLEASKCARKFDRAKAVDYMQQALDLMERQGQFAKAAKLAGDVAEMIDEHKGEERLTPEMAEEQIRWWRKSADCWKMERNSTSHANACLVKIADLLTQQGKYAEAIEINEDLGNQYSDDSLLRFNAKGFYFASLLCHLALIEADRKEEGVAKFRAKFEEYTDKDTQFSPQTHEHRFCTTVLQAFEEGDAKLYSQAHKEYERVHPLDRQKTTMILRGKQALKEAEDDLR
eukprot:TRINITY_DN11828_c0_g1_i1.p1 TRINITY_DN11828_c0_g1~~TRINITY_DN11828_c0_g1_i1.p1  ORF type:complete len:301 (+),score=113.24 TRINITY_DN11828_c0_g1_i1:95-997(+)